MESKAKILGHAGHQMLIVFPLGLFITAVIFDIITLLTHEGRWSSMAFYLIAAGGIGGLLAAIFGLVDWMAIPHNTRAKRVGLVHGIGNLAVMALFGMSWILRGAAADLSNPGTLAYLLSFLGFALSALTGWLGGELVDRLAVGVDHGAHLNSPNSLSGRPASDDAATPAPQTRTIAGD